MQPRQERADLLRLKSAIAAGRLLLAGWRLQIALKYNPNWRLQPRVPAGNGDPSGEWTDDSGSLTGSDGVLLAQAESGQGFSIDLLEEEATGGHAIKEHIGRSAESLLARVRGEQYRGLFVWAGRKRDGSFPSVTAANKLVNATLSRNRAIVEQVASGVLDRAFITATFGSKTGIEAILRSDYSQPYLRDTFGVGVVIIHDPFSRNGFRMVTAYPRND